MTGPRPNLVARCLVWPAVQVLQPRPARRCDAGSAGTNTAARDVDLAKDHHTSYRCVRCGAYFERKRDEEEGFDIEAHSRNANYFGSGGI